MFNLNNLEMQIKVLKKSNDYSDGYLKNLLEVSKKIHFLASKLLKQFYRVFRNILKLIKGEEKTILMKKDGKQ